MHPRSNARGRRGDEPVESPVDTATLYSTGDMARLTSSTLRTIRFYEEAGLLTPAGRREGGHRLFAEDQLRKLRFILDLREAGLSLFDIKSLFELKSQASSAEEASARISSLLGQQIADMEKKIGTLRELRSELESTIALLRNCQECGHSEFPKTCTDCKAFDKVEPPRAARILWGR